MERTDNVDELDLCLIAMAFWAEYRRLKAVPADPQSGKGDEDVTA